MDTSDGLEFVNRGDELEFLLESLNKANQRPALVVLRSPPGFGKSTLTDYLGTASSSSGHVFCFVDPSIRGRVGTVTVHDGFFLQRIAESLDKMAGSPIYPWPTLSNFLKERQKESMATKNPLDIVSELPSLGHTYKVLYDYAARALSFGRYSPEKLLTSDEADAVAISSTYAEHVMQLSALTVVLRETQHIDLHSLRTILLISERHPGPNLIIEYTSEQNQFEPEHQKLFLRAAKERHGIKILDLVRLGADHLEYLIRYNVRSDFTLTSDYYLSWDGNLRSIVELKFQVGLGQTLTDRTQIGKTLAKLNDTIADHVATLSSSELMMLAVVLAHVEVMDESTISDVFKRIDPRSRRSEISKSLLKLEKTHFFLSRSGGLISIRNDTIANTLRHTQSLHGKLALAECALRNHYDEVLNRQVFVTSGFSDSVRQYFRLCARTKDANGLIKAVERLSGDIAIAQDQSIYVDVVASAIMVDSELYLSDHDGLIDWAVELAYDTSDWSHVLNLLSLKNEESNYSRLMCACALQEIGRHGEALKLITDIRRNDQKPETLLATDLIEALITGCHGDHLRARQILERVIGNHEYLSSPLVGYAYRFFEIVDGLEDSLEKLKLSIAWFEKHEFLKSKAYSQLPAAMLLARSGDISSARSMIGEATTALSREVHDRHIILNNRSAVELLSDQPNFGQCCVELNYALRFARDDFSELTILSNLSIAHCGLNEVDAALDCAEKCQMILNDHDFADTDIYWPICFNMSAVYTATGDDKKRKSALQFPFDKASPRTDDLEYWNFRFGKIQSLPDARRFLCQKPWHPVYLSHWLIDLEGLKILKTERQK